MRLGLAVIVILAALAPTAAFADWMIYVARNIATGERTGLIARASTPDGRPVLSIACTSGVLSASFDTGVEPPAGITLAEMPAALAIGADDGPDDMFPVALELHDDDKGSQVRLRFDADEAAGLIQYVLGADASIEVSYRIGDDEVAHLSTSTAGAAVTLGGVLRECAPVPGKIK